MTDGMTNDQFVSITQQAGWADIDTLVSMLDEADFWDEAFLQSSIEERKKAYIRRQIKQVKGEDGFPTFASVVSVDPITGKEERRYKQEGMFDRDDYVQVTRYHEQRSQHHMQMAVAYAERGHTRYGLQLTLTMAGQTLYEAVPLAEAS